MPQIRTFCRKFRIFVLEWLLVKHIQNYTHMTYLWLLLGISLAVSAVGWLYFIYFFSIGYGLSIAALATASLIIFSNALSLPMTLLLATLIVYGIRLATYLFLRERRSASYKKILYQPDNTKRRPLFAMFMIWFSCALLYIGQISPATFYLYNAQHGIAVNSAWAWVGAIITMLGVAIESIADAQKSAAKRKLSNRFVNTGLYRMVRCPNYFGEILMWTGCFIVCFGCSCTAGQWIIASLGYIGIIYVMFSGARRLEMRQAESYGNDPEFQAYVKRTPLLIPLVPIYSVAKHKWLKA